MTIVSVRDTQRPFILLKDTTEALPFHEGVFLARRVGAYAMQVTSSALQTFATDCLYFGPAWQHFPCLPTSGALCVAPDASVALMGTKPVTTPREVAELLPRSALLREFNGVICSGDSSGRTVGTSNTYTVSMCDLVDGQLRFVLTNSGSGGTVYWIRDTTATATYVVLSVIALYAATSLAQKISSLISKKTVATAATAATAATVATATPNKIAERSPFVPSLAVVNVAACFVSVVVLLWLCQEHMHHYASQHDVAMFCVLLFFLVSDLLLLLLKETGKPRDNKRNFGNQIGLSTAILLLVTLRIHNTFDTPFFLVLTGIFGTRSLCKFLQHLHDSLCADPTTLNMLSVLLDLCVWCCLLAYSLAQSSTVLDDLAVATNVVLALMLGLGMSILVDARGDS